MTVGSGLAGAIRIGDGAALDNLTDLLASEQPYRGKVDRLHPARGLVLVGDIRLDNRDELRAALRSDVTDERSLILAGYERWDVAVAERIHGDFAFAIVDPRRERLFLFRDFIGSRPLAYARTRELFAFASEPFALAALPGVDDGLNDAAIVSALVEMGDDGVRTPYRGVSRLR